MTENTNPATEEALPCFVQHESAGGLCGRAAEVELYGLGFCEPHGREVQLGAALEAYDDAGNLLAGLRNNPYAQDALHRLLEDAPSDVVYHEALQRAYPNPSPELRERVREWQLDEQEGYEPVVDAILGQLATLHKLMRIAHAERDTWIVEVLERRREGIAAEAVIALADLEARTGNPA